MTANGAMGPSNAAGIIVDTHAALAFSGSVNYTDDGINHHYR